jgi:hypothetical protein
MFKAHALRFLGRIAVVSGGAQGLTWLLGVYDEVTTWLEDHRVIVVFGLIFFGVWSLFVWDLERHKLKREFEAARKVRRRRRG